MALVLLVVVFNLSVVTFLRGRALAEHRRLVWSIGYSFDDSGRYFVESDPPRQHGPPPPPDLELTPPWRWTSNEWADTVWPWK